MNKQTKWIMAALAASLTIGGCATQSPTKPSGIEQRIESASSPSDHQAIAAEYEKQAAADMVASKMHQSLAVKYKYRSGHKSEAPGSLAMHCKNLAKLYEQAAAENRELARMHREVAETGKLPSTSSGD